VGPVQAGPSQLPQQSNITDELQELGGKFQSSDKLTGHIDYIIYSYRYAVI